MGAANEMQHGIQAATKAAPAATLAANPALLLKIFIYQLF
jgi:hypothetical protein